MRIKRKYKVARNIIAILLVLTMLPLSDISSNIKWIIASENQGKEKIQEEVEPQEKIETQQEAEEQEFDEIEEVVLEDMKITTPVTLTGDTEVANLVIQGGSLDLNGYKLTIHGNFSTYSTTINLNKGYIHCTGDVFIGKYTYLKFTNINDCMRVDGLLKWENPYGTLDKGILELYGDLEFDTSLNLSSQFFQVQFNGSSLQKITQPNTNVRTAFGHLVINNSSEEGVYSNLPLYIINLERNGNKLTYGNKENYTYGWTLYEDQVIDGDLYLAEETLDLNGFTLTVKGNLIQSSGKVLVNGGTLVVEGDYLQRYMYQEEDFVKYNNSTSLLIMNHENDKVSIKGNYYNDSIVNSTGYLTNGKMTVEGDFTVTNASSYNFVAQGDHTLILAGDKDQKITFASNVEKNDFSGLANLKNDKNKEGSVTFTSTIVKENYEADDKPHEGWLYVYAGAIKNIEKIYGNLAFMETTVTLNTIEIEGNLALYQPLTLGNDFIVHKDLEVKTYCSLNLAGYTMDVRGSVSFTNGYYYANQLIMNNENSHLIVHENLILNGKYGILDNGIIEVKKNVTQGGSYSFVASGKLKLLLSGDGLQKVTVNHINTNLNIIEVTNTSDEGIYSDTQVPYNQLILNGNKINYGNRQGVFGWKLEEDQVYHGDLVLIEDTLDLNGHKLTVKGNLVQAGGTIKVNNGSLVVEGDYRLQTMTTQDNKVIYGSSYGAFLMNESNDFVQIKGDFISSCAQGNTTRLTEGRLEIGGDFVINNITQNMFVATNNHTTVFNGTKEQKINLAQTSSSNSRFANIIFENESEEGISIVNPIAVSGTVENTITKMKGRIKPYGVAKFKDNIYVGDVEVSGSYTVNEDVTIKGDLYIESSHIYISGKLLVKGNCQVSYGGIFMEKGKLYIEGDLTLNYYGYYTLSMNNEEDYIYVNGAFINFSNNNSLFKGILEVKGDFAIAPHCIFKASGTHKVILSGDKKQTISLTKGSYFQNIEFRNTSEEGIYIENSFRYNGEFKSNDTKVTIGNINGKVGWTLEEDTVIEDDLHLYTGKLDLNGHTLLIKGDLIVYGGEVVVNKGKLTVEKDLRLQSANVDEHGDTIYGDSTARLKMNNQHDIISVKGNMYIQTIIGDVNDMTAGILEVCGDMKQVGDTNSVYFYSTKDHYIRLSGDKKQNITFGKWSNQYIGNLFVNNDSEEGVNIENEAYVLGKIAGKEEALHGTIAIGSNTSSEKNHYYTNVRTVGYISVKTDVIFEGNLTIDAGYMIQKSKVTVKGHVYSGYYGYIVFREGTLYAESDVSIISHYAYNTQLTMTNPNDYLYIGGNYKSNMHYSNLTNGTIEIKGNYDEDVYPMEATGNHRYVFSGDKLQVITIVNPNSTMNSLEILNESKEGVQTNRLVKCNQLITNGNVYGVEGENYTLGWKLEEDQVIEGDLILLGGTLDLNGYTLTINGDFVQNSSTVFINEGKLLVDKDYYLQSREIKSDDTYEYSLANGILKMQSSKDLIVIKGDFKINNKYSNKNLLTDGVIEVYGDFIDKGSYQSFYATDNHTIKLLGSKKQVIDVTTNTVIHNLVIDNKSKYNVELTRDTNVFGKVTDVNGNVEKSNYLVLNSVENIVNGKWSGSLYLKGNNTLKNDLNVDGTLYVYNNQLNLSKYTITAGSIFLYYTTLDVATGKVNCLNNFTIDRSRMMMLNEEAYVLVGGDFLCNTNSSLKNLLEDGILELKGDFTETYMAAFFPTKNHKTILSGKPGIGGRLYKQTIDFYGSGGASKFNHLELSKPLEKGYLFLDAFENAYNTLTYRIVDTDAPSKVENIKVKEIKATQALLSWDEATDNIGVIGYYIYRNNDKIATVNSTSFRDLSLEPNKTYNYRVYAFDQGRNVSEGSELVTVTTKEDTEAPSVPLNVVIKQRTASSITISWNFSVDNVKVAGYDVYRDGTKIGNTVHNYYKDSTVKEEKEYTYSVVAYDNSDNYSEESNETIGVTAKPKITRVIPEKYATMGGDKANIQVYFSNVGYSTGNKVKLEYSLDGKVYELITPNYLGQNVYDAKEYYASYTWDISNLEHHGLYYVRYTLYDADDNMDQRVVEYNMDKSAPDAPRLLKAVSEDGTIKLLWLPSSSSDVQYYSVYKKVADAPSYTMVERISNITQNTFIDVDVVENREYEYKITATDGYGQESLDSGVIKVQAQKDTASPYIVSISPKSGRINAVKNILVEAKDNIGVDFITLYYKEMNSQEWIFIGKEHAISGKANFNFNTKELEGTYQLKAVATDFTGNESNGAFSGEFIIDNVGITKIEGLRATAGDTFVRLEWDDVSDPDFSYFQIEQKVGNSFKPIGCEYHTLGYYANNLLPNQEYVFRVVGYDDLGNRGITSKEVTATTVEDSVSPVVSVAGPASSRYTGVIELSMTVEDNVGCKKGYFYYSYDKENWTLISEQTADVIRKENVLKTKFDTKEIKEGEIFLLFEAEDAAKNKTKEKVIGTYLIDRTPPKAVNNFKAEGVSGYVSLTWDMAENDVAYYNIYRGNENGLYTLYKSQITTKNYYDTKVKYNTPYSYKIEAVDIAGNVGEKSKEALASALVDTEKPVIEGSYPAQEDTLKANPELQMVALDNSQLAKVTIEYKSKSISEDVWYLVIEDTLSEASQLFKAVWNTKGLESGDYQLRMHIEDMAGNVSDMHMVDFNLDQGVTPVEHVKLKKDNWKLKLTWDKSIDEDIDYYEVIRKSDIEKEYRPITQTKGTSYVDTSVSPDYSYSYKVVAVDKAGNRGESKAVSEIPGNVDTIPPVAIAAEFVQGVVDGVILFDGRRSTDNVGILKYTWDMGDGTIIDGPSPAHVYTKAGEYTAKLTVEDYRGNKNTCKVYVTILKKEDAANTTIKVVDTSGLPIKDAIVYVQFTDESVKNFASDKDGQVHLFTKAGNYKVAAYADGYLPEEASIILYNEDKNEAVLQLKKGELITGDMSIRRMTLEEMVAAGIDLSNPANMESFTFTVELKFEKMPVPVEVEYYIIDGKLTLAYMGGVDPAYGGGNIWKWYGSGFFIQSIAGPPEKEIPVFAYISTTQNIQWLTDIYQVDLGVLNNADPSFVIKDSLATLKLPSGVSLAATYSGQNSTQSMGEISGQQRKQVSWYVKADTPGDHTLSAEFNGSLMPFDIPVSSKFSVSQNFPPSGSGIHVYVMPQDSAYIGEDYYIQFMVRNESNKMFYNFSTSFGQYIDPGAKNHIKITDTQTGEVEEYDDGYVAPEFRLDVPSSCNRLPVLRGGERISVGAFAPGEALYGTFHTVFSAEGDPETEYYKLIEALTYSFDSERTGVTLHVNPIPSHITRYNVNYVTIDNSWADPIDQVTGAYVDSIETIRVTGATTLSFDVDYNSMLTEKKGNLGLGWSHNYENYIEDKGAIITFYGSPSTPIEFVPESAVKRMVNGVIINNQIEINEKQVDEEVLYTGISYGSKEYRLLKKKDSYVMTLPNQDVYTFDKSGKLIQIKELSGKRVEFEQKDDQTIVKEPVSGQRLIIDYNKLGYVTKVRDDHDREVIFTYDTDSKCLTSITNPLKEVTRFEYNKDGKLTKVINNEDKIKVVNTYDDKGRVLTQDDSDPSTPLIKLEYEKTNGGGQKNAFIDRNGQKYSLTIDRNGNVTKMVDPIGGTTIRMYDIKNNLILEQTPKAGTVTYKYDDKGNRTTITDSGNNTTKMDYNAYGNVTSITDPYGAAKSFKYDERQLLIQEISISGKVTKYEYDKRGNLIKSIIVGKGTTEYNYEKGFLKTVEDPKGNVTTYDYDEYGNMKSTKTATDDIESFEYDACGRLKKIVNPYEDTIEYTYNSDGLPTSIKDANKNVAGFTYNNTYMTEHKLTKDVVEKFEYDGEGNTLVHQTTDRKVIRYTYDGVGNLLTTIYPDDSKLINKYDKNSNLIKQTNDAGEETRYEYYANGSIRKIVYPDGSWEAYTYDKNWRLKSVLDNANRLTEYEYDKAGNQTAIIDALGNRTEFEYNKFGNLTKTVDANGKFTTYEYDANNNCIKKINPLNEVAILEYDANNRLKKAGIIVGDEEVAEEYEYDKLGRLHKRTDALGNEFITSYDATGNVATITDAYKNIVSTNKYNALNQLIKTTDALGTINEFYYNAANQIEVITENLGTEAEKSTSYVYDELGRLKTVTDELKGVSEQIYDEAGNIKEVKNSMGGVNSYKYDKMHRVTNLVNDVLGETTYKYNAAGLLKEAKNGRDQKTYYDYDALGRITSFTDELGTVAYVYDKVGNVLEVKDEKGTIKRTFDDLNRVETYTDYKGNTIKYSYDELGNLISLTYPGGEIVRYEYADNGNLLNVVDERGRTTSYEYDKNGRLVKTSRPDKTVEEYVYDINGRLISQVDKSRDNIIHTYEYKYNEAGHVVTVTSNKEDRYKELVSVKMNYDGNNRLIKYNGKDVGYDKDGNMIYGPLNGKMATYKYDCRNRLIKAGKTTYEYDAENARIAVNEPNARQEYVVDKNNQFTQVLEVTTYLADENGDYALEGEKTKYYYGNKLIAQENKELGYVSYHYNNIGSTTGLTDIHGKVIRTYSYGAYGELLDGDTTGILFLYNGQYGVITDSNSLYYMRARYYNPEIKRFINQDVLIGSIENSQSLNRYSYVQGNPISLIDPFGLSPYNIFSEAGHAFLNVLGFIPGIGDVVDVINGVWYLAEGRYAEGISSFISALPFVGSLVGNGLKLAFKGSKGIVKTAFYIEKGCRIASGVSTLYRAGAGAGEGVLNMYDKYIVENQKVSVDTLGELFSISLNTFACVMAGKGLKSDISDVAKFAKMNKVQKAPLKMNLQFFGGKGGSETGTTRRQAFRDAKESAGIPKSTQPNTHGFVYDGTSENRIVYEFTVDGHKKYTILHLEDKMGRGPHFHGADGAKGNPFNKGRYNQYPGHYPDDFGGFK